jgi:hypothetical protein
MKQVRPLPAFTFKPISATSSVHVFNDKSYLMAQYNQLTGKTVWQRVVLATQRASVETFLQLHYPALSGQPA